MAEADETWRATIGLEVHVQLATKGKLFTDEAIVGGKDAPNTNLTRYTLGHPGCLPVLNPDAVDLAVRAALVLGCEVETTSYFDRKHYFYPDLPKGYQITQHTHPLARHGTISLPSGKRVRIDRLHIEEDAGRIRHAAASEASRIDYNRAGIPLAEIVTAPCLSSAAEAARAASLIRDQLVHAGVTEGQMQWGHLRFDVNVSLTPSASTALGPRVELKNLNSFRFLREAVELELSRQRRARARGQPVISETRGYDPRAGQTFVMRAKETTPDYRYIRDPDLDPLVLTPERIERCRPAAPPHPAESAEVFAQRLGLTVEQARYIEKEDALKAFFEAAVRFAPERAADIARALPRLRAPGSGARLPKVSPQDFAALIEAIHAGQIRWDEATLALRRAESAGEAIHDAIRHTQAAGVDEDQVRQAIAAVLAEHPNERAALEAGKARLISCFVGQTLRRLGGQADPRMVRQWVERMTQTE